jgi:hypothetical protein
LIYLTSFKYSFILTVFLFVLLREIYADYSR